MAKKRKKRDPQLAASQPDAAGMDIGASEIFVAVPTDRDSEPIRRFPTFTRDLNKLADWLESCGIRTVAMESTSAYWIPIYQILEERGFELYMVNAQYVKNVPGRKSDVSDCQWIQYLHSVGLLRASFRPPGQICAIRSLWRHRTSLIQRASEHIMHMQKALDQMNLQVHRVLSDITGGADFGYWTRFSKDSAIRSSWPSSVTIWFAAARIPSLNLWRAIIDPSTCLHCVSPWPISATTKP